MTAPVKLNATAVLALVGIGVAAYAVYRGTQAAGKIAGAVGQGLTDAAYAVSPLNHDNILSKGVNSVGGAIVSDTGPGRNADGSWTLGGWFYDVTNPDTAKAVKDATATIEPWQGGATGTW